MQEEVRYIKGEKAKIDVAVLLIFFCRSDKFEKVFEQVKLAQPSKLYLYQDGPRRQEDIEGIERCREIAAQIDWECEIHTWYQEKNVGCDPSEYLAQRWMFDNEEMGIVLEDDDVPSQSFFPFCKELLDKYKDDERVNIICGMNNTGVSENVTDSYLFTTKGSCWGWASWKRVVSKWNEEYPWLERKQDLNNLRGQRLKKHEYKLLINTVIRHKQSKREHYETIGGVDLYLYNRLNIVPKYNMISNIGVGNETTHGASDIRLLPKRTQRLFYMKRYEIEFPLKHPRYMMPDYIFEKKMEYPTWFENLMCRIEAMFRKLYYHIIQKGNQK